MVKGRSKNKGKRSAATLPKGIPHKRGGGGGPSPFEYARTTNSASRAKHQVHNRLLPGQRFTNNGNNNNGQTYQSSLAKSIALRKTHLADQIANEGKANQFIDRRIGEATRNKNYDGPSKEDVMLKRIVQERVRRSKKNQKFNLDDDDDADEGGLGLTHRGKVIDENYKPNAHTDILLSDSDDEDLDKVDTALHFGGGKFDRENQMEQGAYGPTGGDKRGDMGEVYRSRKEELEERIKMKKMQKAEKVKRKEDQAETFETMDDSFAELSNLLNFRDKEQERVKKREDRQKGTLSPEEMEMEAWDKEMKQYLFERKVAATDRTKTPEEIAKNEADRLHKLESKRLARMAGDFLSEDEFSDVSDDEAEGRKKKKRRLKGEEGKKKRDGHANPEEMSDSDDEDEKEEENQVQFTADGLMYVDKHGKVIGKVGDEDEKDGEGERSEEEGSEEDSDEDDAESEKHDLGGSDDLASAADAGSNSDDDMSTDGSHQSVELKKGMKVEANYHAAEQYGKKATWYSGMITAVRENANGNTVYDVTYDDADFEDGMTAENIRPAPKSEEEKVEENKERTDKATEKRKRQKAKWRAKETIPFVFEVPTTLDALHDLISRHATTGADVTLIIQRIHSTNSVCLNHKNKQKMQNFYDVLLKRFIAVGDAIFESGSGGEQLGRYEQLNELTKILYSMSQDSSESAGAVWSRRLGIFQKALSKRLRDVEVTPLGDACEGEFTAWPSTGMLLLMRALPHIFPTTDKRHAVVTPALLLLGQMLAQTPIKTRYDVNMGLFCTGLMLEYTKGAGRLPPEAMAFLAGVLRLFADQDVNSAMADSPLPSLSSAFKSPQLTGLRTALVKLQNSDTNDVCLSLEKADMQSRANPLAILNSTLLLVQQAFSIIGKSGGSSGREIFGESLKSLLFITGKRKDLPLPPSAKTRLAETAQLASEMSASNTLRQPLQRRKSASVKDLAIKTLAPRMEDPRKYSLENKDKGKSELRAEHDRNRREYKREHKAAMRELRLDSSFVESERRKTKDKVDGKAREKRHKNFAWLEGEQATMNQQVRLGGGLISGGGTGAARAKAKSGKLGMKKGGKFN